MARIIGEVRPRYVFVENSPLLISRGLTTVLGDLAQMGYDAEWCIVSASDCGAPHKRDRCWIVADAECKGLEGFAGDGYRGDESGWEQAPKIGPAREGGISWWEKDPADTEPATKPGLGRVANGVAHRVDRLKAIGNGQIPIVAATAWEILTQEVIDYGK
jgi:DNA (cytosine-5)-methyltransferase 1